MRPQLFSFFVTNRLSPSTYINWQFFIYLNFHETKHNVRFLAIIWHMSNKMFFSEVQICFPTIFFNEVIPGSIKSQGILKFFSISYCKMGITSAVFVSAKLKPKLSKQSRNGHCFQIFTWWRLIMTNSPSTFEYLWST